MKLFQLKYVTLILKYYMIPLNLFLLNLNLNLDLDLDLVLMGSIPNTPRFPPNPEDGELWLPSCILCEITTSISPPSTSNFPLESNLLFPNPPSPSNFEICFGSLGTKTIVKGGANGEVVPVSFRSPIITPSFQGFEGENAAMLVEKYGGTGVFLPRVASGAAPEIKPEESRGGTGVFLNKKGSVTCHKKSKTSDKKGETLGSNNQKKCIANKNENLGKKEDSQHPSGIRLPKDWTY